MGKIIQLTQKQNQLAQQNEATLRQLITDEKFAEANYFLRHNLFSAKSLRMLRLELDSAQMNHVCDLVKVGKFDKARIILADVMLAREAQDRLRGQLTNALRTAISDNKVVKVAAGWLIPASTPSHNKVVDTLNSKGIPDAINLLLTPLKHRSDPQVKLQALIDTKNYVAAYALLKAESEKKHETQYGWVFVADHLKIVTDHLNKTKQYVERLFQEDQLKRATVMLESPQFENQFLPGVRNDFENRLGFCKTIETWIASGEYIKAYNNLLAALIEDKAKLYGKNFVNTKLHDVTVLMAKKRQDVLDLINRKDFKAAKAIIRQPGIFLPDVTEELNKLLSAREPGWFAGFWGSSASAPAHAAAPTKQHKTKKRKNGGTFVMVQKDAVKPQTTAQQAPVAGVTT